VMTFSLLHWYIPVWRLVWLDSCSRVSQGF
jgi:hypothetical protein